MGLVVLKGLSTNGGESPARSSLYSGYHGSVRGERETRNHGLDGHTWHFLDIRDKVQKSFIPALPVQKRPVMENTAIM